MRIPRSVAGFAAGFIAVMSVAAPVAAHDGPIGEGGPFKIEITSGLPAEIEARWGNGELELHVPTGVEVVALGLDSEPFVKIDTAGTMFANMNSPTWAMAQSSDMTDQMNMTGMEAPMDATAEPDWQFVQSGGSVQYHDHRIHFMAASIAPAIADGGVVAAFTLPFIVDGAPVDVVGNLMFDPTLDPVAAEQLLAAGASAVTAAADMAEGSSSGDDNGTSPVVLAALAAVIIAGAAAGGLVLRYRSKQDNPDSKN